MNRSTPDLKGKREFASSHKVSKSRFFARRQGYLTRGGLNNHG